MEKNTRLKWQLYIAITVSYILIIGTATYFFVALNQRIDTIKARVSEIQHAVGSSAELNLFFNDIDSTISIMKMRTLVLIVLLMLFLMFLINRIVKTIRELRRRSVEMHQLNKEIQAAQKQIEDTNWALAHASKLNERISGVDEEDRIAKIAFDSILDSIGLYAAALYIRRTDSDEYILKQHIGVDPTLPLLRSFIEGEGLIGHIAKNRKLKIIAENNKEILRSSSALRPNQVSTVIVVPFVYERRTWGLLEIGGDFPEESRQKTVHFLERTARSIAIAIKSGQAHLLLEHLLEETQQQTEELEAQQEELRVTNEELTYKTNLLEASEEELRVQQEELQQTNTQLEEQAQQLVSRNDELNAAKKTVEDHIKEVELASKYKSEFMANMSHELRTPLNSILILAKLLQDNKAENLHPDQVNYASVIHSAGNDLLQLINQLLDLAKIEAGKAEVNHDTIYTREFVNNIESLFATTAETKDIQLNIHINNNVAASFICDEYRLEQVLKNFLSNAFKFTDSNGKVQLTITQDNEQLVFSVSDTGKGISPEKQQLIFEAFRQEDGSTSRKYGGTGLGLSISREIALLLGGHISLASEVGKGSTFTLTIPYIAADQTKKSEESPIGKGFGGIEEKENLAATTISDMAVMQQETETDATKTLLIVEDDVNFAEILRQFAESYGFQVTLAYNGADGIRSAKGIKPQAIILDVVLPVFDGWEVLRTLKSDPETQHIPIHMMSAANFNQRESIEKGAIGFLAKPVSEDALRKAFKHIQLNIKEGIKKVLLVEDQEFQSDIIKSAFAEHNINVVQAFSAQSALSKLKSDQKFDCVILDIQLPDADGLDVLDKIKAMPPYAETPIIINTAYDLSKEQIDHVSLYTKAMVLKSDKSNNRLIDEVTLFLNKISTERYTPVKNATKLEKTGQQPDNLEGKKVLIADDDMRNIFALTTALQAYNMNIEIANNGLEAVEIVNNNIGKIDIVLMDIMMPEMDGYEAIKKIRDDKQHATLPIITITAKAMKDDREKSIRAGANDYISKPIDIDKLISLMRVWLS